MIPNSKSFLMNHQYNLVFDGQPKDYYLIWAKGFYLGIATFGIYWIWQREKIRTYLASKFSFFGQRFHYKPSGCDALKIFAFASGPALLNWLMITVVSYFTSTLLLPLLLAVLTLPFCYSWWRYCEINYIVNRISWGKHPCSFQSNCWAFLLKDGGGLVLSLFTLGIYLPFWRNEQYRLLIDGIGCRNLQLRYTGKASEIFEDYLSSFPSIVVTGGISGAWLKSKIWRYRIAHTWIGGDDIGTARGFYGVGGFDYLKLFFSFWPGAILSVFSLKPFLNNQQIYFKLQRFAMIGHLDLHKMLNDGSQKQMKDISSLGF